MEFVYNTGRSKASSSSAFSGKSDNSAHARMVYADKHLMHVCTHHDQITLFSVHVKNEDFDLIKNNFAQVNIAIDQCNCTLSLNKKKIKKKSELQLQSVETRMQMLSSLCCIMVLSTIFYCKDL